MRTATMSDGLHGRLVASLTDQRKRASDAIRLIEANVARDWKGIPPVNRRSQEERLPTLRLQRDELTECIDALAAATTH